MTGYAWEREEARDARRYPLPGMDPDLAPHPYDCTCRECAEDNTRGSRT